MRGLVDSKHDGLDHLSEEYADYIDGILVSHNNLRVDPKGYAKKLESNLEHFDGDLLQLPGHAPVMTNEGPVAVSSTHSTTPIPLIHIIPCVYPTPI